MSRPGCGTRSTRSWDWSRWRCASAGSSGRILPLDRLADAPRYVAELIRGAGEFRERSVALREQWAFNFGRSVEVGAREIARIADERAGIGALGIAR